MSKLKFPAEKKVEIIEAYKSGKVAYSQLEEVYGLNPDIIYGWLARYEKQGITAFLPKAGYTKEFKEQCVTEYLRGESSLAAIVAKYNISCVSLLQKWIKRYNAGQEFRDFNPRREGYMADAGRKTTLEERKEIVAYCITHGKDYKGTATFYEVSYSQVYYWVKKYLSEGEAGLEDKRGHHKADDDVDELERLRRENARLKRQLEERGMTVELLKKVKEFERM